MLRGQVEAVQEHGRVHDVDGGGQARQRRVGRRVEEVGGEEERRGGGGVAEEGVPGGDEAGQEVGAVEGGGGDAGVEELVRGVSLFCWMGCGREGRWVEECKRESMRRNGGGEENRSLVVQGKEKAPCTTRAASPGCRVHYYRLVDRAKGQPAGDDKI